MRFHVQHSSIQHIHSQIYLSLHYSTVYSCQFSIPWSYSHSYKFITVTNLSGNMCNKVYPIIYVNSRLKLTHPGNESNDLRWYFAFQQWAPFCSCISHKYSVQNWYSLCFNLSGRKKVTRLIGCLLLLITIYRVTIR